MLCWGLFLCKPLVLTLWGAWLYGLRAGEITGRTKRATLCLSPCRPGSLFSLHLFRCSPGCLLQVSAVTFHKRRHCHNKRFLIPAIKFVKPHWEKLVGRPWPLLDGEEGPVVRATSPAEIPGNCPHKYRSPAEEDPLDNRQWKNRKSNRRNYHIIIWYNWSRLDQPASNDYIYRNMAAAAALWQTWFTMSDIRLIWLLCQFSHWEISHYNEPN